MQTRDQVKNWKVVVSAASVAALGLTGLAVASPGSANDAPPAIDVNDQRDRVVDLTTTTTPSFEVVPGPVTQFDSIDSPDDSLLASASIDDSPDAAIVDDSPDNPVDPPDDSIDSPDDSIDSPDDSDSADSPDSSD